MKMYQEQVRKWVKDDLQAKFVQIPREENKQADCLAKVALAEHMLISSKVLSFVQLLLVIDNMVVQEIGLAGNWTTPIFSYLRDGTPPDGKEATRKLKVQMAQFVLVRGILYKKGFPRPYLRCLTTKEVDYVMREVLLNERYPLYAIPNFHLIITVLTKLQ